jgi:hypothetical protein
MGLAGQWSCEACARANGYGWGLTFSSSPHGWCGVGSHRVNERIEFVPDAICQNPVVIRSTQPERMDAPAAAIAETADLIGDAPHPIADEPDLIDEPPPQFERHPDQMDLFG